MSNRYSGILSTPPHSLFPFRPRADDPPTAKYVTAFGSDATPNRLFSCSCAGNYLSGQMPDELGQLTSLAYLCVFRSCLERGRPAKNGRKRTAAEDCCCCCDQQQLISDAEKPARLVLESIIANQAAALPRSRWLFIIEVATAQPAAAAGGPQSNNSHAAPPPSMPRSSGISRRPCHPRLLLAGVSSSRTTPTITELCLRTARPSSSWARFQRRLETLGMRSFWICRTRVRRQRGAAGTYFVRVRSWQGSSVQHSCEFTR